MSKEHIPEKLTNLVPDDEKVVLDREFDEYIRNPDAGSNWEDVEARLLNPQQQ
jgi:hypothetical protein